MSDSSREVVGSLRAARALIVAVHLLVVSCTTDRDPGPSVSFPPPAPRADAGPEVPPPSVDAGDPPADAGVVMPPPIGDCRVTPIELGTDVTVRPRRVHVAARGDHVLAAWSEQEVGAIPDEGQMQSVTESVYARTIAAGGFAGSEMRLTDAETVERDPMSAPGLVVFEDDLNGIARDVMALRVGDDGAIVGAPWAVTGSPDVDESSPAVVPRGTGWTVSWVRETEAGFAIDARGVLEDGTSSAEPTRWAETTLFPRYAVASRGGDTLVVAYTDGAPRPTRVLTSHVHTGVPATPQLVYEATDEVLGADIAFDEMQGVVSVDVADGVRRHVISRLVDFDGEPTRPEWSVSDAGEIALGSAAVAFQGGFMVAYRGYRQGTSESPGVVVRFVHGSTGEAVLRLYVATSGLDDGPVDAAAMSDGSIVVTWATTDLPSVRTQIHAAHIECPDIWLRCSEP